MLSGTICLMFQLTIFSSILFVTTLVNLAVTSLSWQRRETPGGMFFALGMLAVSLWTLASGLDYAATTIPLKLFFAQWETLGYNSALACFTAFSLIYAGYETWLNRLLFKGLLIIIPFLNTSLAWTNPLHNLYWRGFHWSEAGGNVLIFEHGSAFSWVVLTNYLLVIVMLVALWQSTWRGSELSRRQARLLFSALLIPVVGNIFYHLNLPGLEGIDWSSITFSISGLVFLLALYGTRLLDLVPVARHSLVELLEDAILVLDVDNRLIDFNLSARNLLGINEKQVGSPLAEILPEWAAGIRSVLLVSSTRSPSTFLQHETAQYFDVSLSDLLDRRGLLYGRLVVFRDVSQRFRAEQNLAYRLAEIQLLNENLRRAQDDLITQQRALARLEERQRLGRDMHDSVNQSIHGMMLFSDTLMSLLRNGQTEKAMDVVARMQASGRQALQEIRLMLFETHSRFAAEKRMTLAEALEERLNMVERRVGIHVSVDMKGDAASLPQEISENLYWLAIEALNNALKYAHASHLVIKLQMEKTGLVFEVNDNGQGFDPGQVNSGGVGLRSMQERAALLGGKFNIESSPGQGTSVVVKLKTEVLFGNHKNPDR